MPHLQRFWNESKDKGLHVFHIESQGHTREQVEDFCKDRKVTFPQTLRDGSDFGSFPGGNGLPYAYIIGVDGKVLWQGRSGYMEVLARELEKVRYPGLGKQEVAAPVQKAATLFGARRYAQAMKEAQKVVDAGGDEATLSDAQRVLARAQKIADYQRGLVESTRAAEDYLLTIEALTSLSTWFKENEIGEQAKSELAEMKKDKQVKQSLQADEAWAKVAEDLVKYAPADQKKVIEGFLKKFDGTRAAKQAKEHLAKI